MKRIRNLKKYKLFLLLGSIFLIYMFSHKLFGAEQKITSISLERIQGDVKNKLFDVLSANELTTKNELDQYITTSQNILIELKDENQKTQKIIQPVAPATVQPIHPISEQIPEPEPMYPEPVAATEIEPIQEEPIFGPEPEPMPEPILEEPIFSTEPKLMPESIPTIPEPIISPEPMPEPMLETNQTPTIPPEMPPIPMAPGMMEEEIFESTGGTEIAEMIPPTPPTPEPMFPEMPEGMEP